MFTTTCDIDVRYFPFDDQLCVLEFGAWAYYSARVNITSAADSVSVCSFRTLSGRTQGGGGHRTWVSLPPPMAAYGCMIVRSDVSVMSESDVGDQQMLITVSTNFKYFVYVPFISSCGRYPVHERFPLSSSSSFAFNHPGQCNGFQLILSHNMTHKSDLPAGDSLACWLFEELDH